MSDYSLTFESALGLIQLTASTKGLTGLLFDAKPAQKSSNNDYPILSDALKQLDEYFQGKRKEFSIPLDMNGTEFQMRVWDAVVMVLFLLIRILPIQLRILKVSGLLA